MKAVLRSIKPYWLYLIIIGKKTIEVGKDFPKADDWSRDVVLYCSKDLRSFNRIPEKDREWMQKYLGRCACRFVCDDIDTIAVFNDLLYCEKNSQANKLNQMCLTIEEIKAYLGSKNQGYNWHISDLKIYDKLKELSEFHKPIMPTGLRYEADAIARPPQSWCYVEEGATDERN